MEKLEREQRSIIYRCIAGIILLLAAVAVNHYVVLDSRLVRIALFLIPYLTVAYDVVIEAFEGIFHGELLDEHFLMFIATVGAFFLEDYPEAVGVMLFYQIGELFQDIAVNRSKHSIESMMELKPEAVTVIRSGAETTVKPEEVSAGETIVIRPGERVPIDGMITEGSAMLDTSALTGESLPREVNAGDNIQSGVICLNSMLKVRTTGVYGESTVAKILDMVRNSVERKAKAESFITRFAHIYTPCVVAAAALVAILPPLAFGGDFSEWLSRALMFLVVSCPCALVISVPLSFFSGIGAASRSGILIKGADSIEAMEKVKTVVFDKTGTITKGTFAVSGVHDYSDRAAELLDIAALAESYSDHPIAASIVRAHGGHVDKSRISEIEELAGRGIRAVIDGNEVLAGNEKLIKVPDISACHGDHNGTVVHISIGGEYRGHIVISDEIKPESKQAISTLHKEGIEKTVMLTGDNAATAEPVGKAVGIDEIHASLLPADKLEYVKKYCAESKTAFVGDGINDAPAIAQADVGIAMGISGSDAAIETADVVLMDDSPAKVAKALSVAKRTMRIVRENIWVSLIVKIGIMACGVFGFGGMWLAVFGDVGVTVLAVLNATKLLYSRK